ncbi:MAG: ABC transporter permease [Rhodocyclaceae bacterium]|nr:ABC transporter permease [Rhodocyclaceae bacterium]
MTGAVAVARRLPAYALALLALASLDFALPQLMPGDPAAAFLGQDALVELSAAQRDQLLAELGLDQPLWRQYVAHLGQLVRLDLGQSLRHGLPVAELLAQHLPWTLLLAGAALAGALVMGTLLGMEAAFAQGGWIDRALTAAMLAMESVPTFAVAMGLVLLFAYGLPWFPAAGAMAPFSSATGLAAWSERAHHLALPVAALALPASAGIFLVSRAAAVAMLPRLFMDTARAKGVGRFALRYRHLAPNVLAVVVARLGGLSARIVSNGIFVEIVFAYPGINLLLTDAIAKHDYPLVRGALLAIGLLLFALNLAADLLVARMAQRAGRLPS